MSKSNLCDPVVTSWVRKILESSNCEILEHRGGTYDESLIFSADAMVVVTAPGSGDGVGSIDRKIGRGVYSQINAAQGESIPVMVVTGSVDGAISVANVLSVRKFNQNDWTKEYGILSHDPNSIDLKSFLCPTSDEILLSNM